MTEYTTNKLILAYAEVRYRVGLKVKYFMQEHNLTSGFWILPHHWSVDSEGRYNCLIEPELGRRIKAESRREFFMLLTQYGPGKSLYRYEWSVPFVWQFYSRIPALYNWATRQNRIAYWSDEQNREFAEKLHERWPEMAASLRELVADASVKRNYWKEKR